MFRISRKILIEKFIYLFIIVLIFQRQIVSTNIISKFLILVDEFLSLVGMLFFIFFCFYTFRINKKLFYILLLLIIFSIIGLISGFYNGNNIYVTILGIFDYFKNFLFIFLVYMLGLSLGDLNRLYNKILKFIILICVIAFFIFFCFILDIKLPNFIGYITEIRFGVPRICVLGIHPNMLGLLSLLFFILDSFVFSKFNFNKFFLLCGILFSVSSIVYLGLTFFIIFMFQNKNKNFLGLFFIIILSIIIIYNFIPKIEKEIISEGYYRGYVLKKSLEIWKDYPILGVGPGMYGGVVSVRFNSPVYERYNFSNYWYNYGLASFSSLDMFWPQILVEYGLLGTILFVYFLFFLHRISVHNYIYSNIEFIKKFSLGLSLIPIVIFIYLFGSGLNLTPFLAIYSIFLGICFGVKNLNENITYK